MHGAYGIQRHVISTNNVSYLSVSRFVHVPHHHYHHVPAELGVFPVP